MKVRSWFAVKVQIHIGLLGRWSQGVFLVKQIYTDLIDEPEEFSWPLMEYLVWYNTERVYRSIGKVAPLRYYVDKFIADPKQSNMYWTLTPSSAIA